MRINTPTVNHQLIDGEVVAVNLVTGVYYSLVDVAAAIWERLGAGETPAEIAGEFDALYGPDAAESAAAFIEELLTEGLLSPEAAEKSGAALTLALPNHYSPPRLEKYTDMQELLMLDPIHEIDERGWPHKPPDA